MSYTSQSSGSTIVGETELYEFLFPTEEYYTTQSRPVTLPEGHALNPDGPDKTYLPLPITRDRLVSRSGETASTLRVTMPITSGIKGQVLIGGEGVVSVKIIRGFGDPLSAPEDYRRYWFQGDMTDLAISESIATLKLEDSRYLLSLKQIPQVRVTRQCGHLVYETGGKNGKCDVVESDFTFTFLAELVTEGGKSILLSPSTEGAASGQHIFDEEGSPGNFSLGRVWLAANPKAQSAISGHDWDGARATIQLHKPVKGLLAGSILNLSWGCDWRETTCKARFSNFANFQGSPVLPTLNPATNIVFNKP